MAIRYGVGIENETVFTHMDSDRKRVNSYTSHTPPAPGSLSYREIEANWNPTRKWKVGRGGDIGLSGDPTVREKSGNGMEFQSMQRVSMGVKPKQAVQMMSDAINDLAKHSSGRSGLRTKMKNPFGSAISESNASVEDGFGSYRELSRIRMRLNKDKQTN